MAEESLFTSITGFDDVGDMFDGGGKGGSGDQFYSGTNEEYVEAGGTNVGGDDNTFIDRVTNTAKNENELDYNPPEIPQGGGGDGGSSGGAPAAGQGEGEGEDASTGLTADDIFKMAEEAGIDLSNEQINELLADPQGWLESKGMEIFPQVPVIDADADGTTLDPNNPDYDLGDTPNVDATTVDEIAGVDTVDPKDPTTYTADTVTDDMEADPETYQVDPVTGEIRDENLVDADDIEIDMKGAATGVNEDGTVNETGVALNDYATQSTSNIIDTSTVAGKLLAEKLGEGNYTDSKATILGQMEIISGAFKDSNGNPIIPPFAQGIARQLSRTMAFKGVTGTAATAAMANALMEASLGVAEKEASFFQTLTVKNLDNRQQAIINKANVLAKFEITNADARETAAVQNAQAFLEMDLKNLTNEQQAEVINTQARIDALLEDSRAINAERLFTAEARNDFTKYYDTLNTNIKTFMAEQQNAIAKFNAGEINSMAQFEATMEDSRQKFYAEMQFNIDTANAKWRQSVEVDNKKMQYDAISTDVKNMLDISQEAQNQLWDRVDSLFDYIWKSSENDMERDVRVLLAQISAQAGSKGGGGLFGFLGDLAGAMITKAVIGSDERLKTNIEYFDTLPSGIKMYTWDWTEEAKKRGFDENPPIGVIAQEIQKTHPDAVIEGPDGYLRVNYTRLFDEV